MCAGRWVEPDRDRGERVQPELSLVIPAFNEGRVMRRTLTTLVGLLDGQRRFEIVVSDDGSTDDTARIVGEMAQADPRIQLVRSQENRGKGHAARLGVEATRGRHVLCTDADLVFGLEHLDDYVAAIDAGADLALGNRSHPDSRFVLHPKHFPYLNQRHWMGRIFSWLVRVLVRLDATDTQCGFKLFRGDVARKLFAESRIDGFAYDVEVLFLASKDGCRVVSLPVSISYEGNPSSVRLARNALPMLLDVLRIRCDAGRTRK